MMKNWSIQRRFLLIALLPAAVLAFVLSVYSAYQQIHAAERQAIEHARAVAAEIAMVAGHAALAGKDEALLEGLTNTLVTERSEIAGIIIRDRAGNVFLRAQRAAPPAPETGDAVRISHLIRGPSAADTPITAIDDSESLGTIEIAVNLARVRREQVGRLLEDLVLTIIALGITALVAVRISRSVTDPVHELIRAIERIRSGEYDYRPCVGSGGELGQLERGVRELTAGMERTKRSLHDRIEVATRELQATLAKLEERNAELESARREAEAASEFKTRFLASISHEIRTPMNSILGFTELLERADLDPVHTDYLATIQSSAQSLLSLLNGILDLSKIESRHMELEFADANVNELLFETFNLLAPQAFAKGVEFVVRPTLGRNSVVRVDAVRLKQVLINLASNAVKFTDQGCVQISAQSVSRADGSLALTFSFVDTGRGIPQEAQAHLVQAFAQSEDMRGEDLPRATGTGLGLHIASEIVFLMDGLIEFRSEPGGGSEFWFTLELDHAHAALAGSEHGPRRRVMLVIDGDPDFIATHVDILATAGIDADPITPAHSTAEYSDTIAVDAILVHISARDVYEGRVPPSRSIPTGNAPVFAYIYAEDPDIHRLLLDGGFASVIQKTPDPRILRRALERALDKPDRGGGPPPYYDSEDARTRAGGRPGVADELFTMLCRHLPSSRAELCSAHDRNDAQALLTAAHRLKGAAAYCGVPRLRHEITVLEERVRRGDNHAVALDAVWSTIDALLEMDRSDRPDPHTGDA